MAIGSRCASASATASSGWKSSIPAHLGGGRGSLPRGTPWLNRVAGCTWCRSFRNAAERNAPNRATDWCGPSWQTGHRTVRSADVRWQSHAGHELVRVTEASCCEEYVLCHEAAEFLVRRRTTDGTYEETARGPYARAARVWLDLASGHVCDLPRSPVNDRESGRGLEALSPGDRGGASIPEEGRPSGARTFSGVARQAGVQVRVGVVAVPEPLKPNDVEAFAPRLPL